MLPLLEEATAYECECCVLGHELKQNRDAPKDVPIIPDGSERGGVAALRAPDITSEGNQMVVGLIRARSARLDVDERGHKAREYDTDDEVDSSHGDLLFPSRVTNAKYFLI